MQKRTHELDLNLADAGESATVKSARRGLEILEYFAQGVRAATVTQVANELAYTQSSTSVLLASLTTLGYLRFDPEQRIYSPTVRVMLLGSWLQSELFGQGSLVTAMEKLRQRTGQTVMIGLRQGIHVRFIFSLQGKEAQALRYPVGVLRPVCRSAVGKVLLSPLSDTKIQAIARHANAEAQEPEHRVNIRALLEEMTVIRKQGWAMALDYPLPNRSSLAVALPEMSGQPAMALTVGARKSVMLERHAFFLAELRNACTTLVATQQMPATASDA